MQVETTNPWPKVIAEYLRFKKELNVRVSRLQWDGCTSGLIAHPHILVQANNERFLQAGATFSPGSASESHWLQPVLVLTVHWWPAPVCVGRL